MNGNDEIYRPCHLMTPGSTSMYFLSYIWVDFLNPKRLIKCLILNIDRTVFRAMVLDYKLEIRNYNEIWNTGHMHPVDYADRASTALTPTAVHRHPLFRDNSCYNMKKIKQFSVSWLHSQKLHKLPNVSFCCLSYLF